jgi:hypothetical protein
MRRTASVILFIFGAWLLACGVMIAGFDFDGRPIVGLGSAGILAGVAAPFLLVGSLVSPGNRLADLGMTLMIAAAIGGGLGLMTFGTLNDPNFKQLMPPGQQLPILHFALIPGAAVVLIVAGAGFALWWFGRSRERRAKPDLERIFGDE